MAKKIMFSDKYGLTQAVLEGRKTQTRRIIPKDFFSLTWDKRDDTLVYENSMGDFPTFILNLIFHINTSFPFCLPTCIDKL